MARTKEILAWIDTLAPREYAEDWDVVGPQVYFDDEVSKVVLAMDVTDQVVKVAIEEGAQLILSHHPFFFSPLSLWEEGDYKSNLIKALLDHRITVISAHTNLDRAKGGVNDALASVLEIENIESLQPGEEEGIGLVGTIPEANFEDVIQTIREKIHPTIFHAYGKKPKTVQKIGLCGGAGAEFMKDALSQKADLYITGDMKHHDGQWAYEHHLCVLDIGHMDSERFVLYALEKKIKEDFPEMEVMVYDKKDFEINLN